MSYNEQYRQKLISGEKAAGLIKSGDKLVYAGFLLEPEFTDGFIAKRIENKELYDLSLLTMCYPGFCLAAAADPKREHLVYNNAFFSPGDRILHEMGTCDHVPSLFSEIPTYFENQEPFDILYLRTAPRMQVGFLILVLLLLLSVN